MGPVRNVSNNIFVFDVGVDVQGLLARKLSEFSKFRIRWEVNRISVGKFGIWNYDVSTDNVAPLSLVYRMLREIFISFASSFGDANLGWTPSSVLKLHHELWPLTFFKVLNSKHDSDPRSLIQVELPSGGLLSIQELLLGKALRIRKLLLRNLQRTLCQIVGSVSLARIESKAEERKQLNPEFRLPSFRPKTLQQRFLMGCCVLVSVIFLTLGLSCIHESPRSGWCGLLGLILILGGLLLLYHWYDMFGL